MKRDMDLVRAIVLAIEDDPHGYAPRPIEVEGHTDEEVGYHVHIMAQGGLLNGIDVSSNESLSPVALASSLTWAGHEFADAARDGTRWSKAKEMVVSKAGSVTIEILSKILSKMMAQSLGM